jgi:hypothetical protein
MLDDSPNAHPIIPLWIQSRAVAFRCVQILNQGRAHDARGRETFAFVNGGFGGAETSGQSLPSGICISVSSFVLSTHGLRTSVLFCFTHTFTLLLLYCRCRRMRCRPDTTSSAFCGIYMDAN